MIGFKTVDNFSFDECVVFLNGHDDKDASWAEINQRYLQLLTQFQREDESAFKTCKTHDDYKNYLHRFTNISGATNYRPLHEEEAKEFLMTHPVPPPIPTPTPTPERGFFSAYWTGAKQRNRITNIVLYILLFASLAVALLMIPATIMTLIDYFENDYRFINVYGYGLIPGFLLATVAFIGISKIIKWKRSGMPIMIISLFIIIFPTIFNEYSRFDIFSVFTLFGLALLWAILKLKKKGVSTWKMCSDMPRWSLFLQCGVLTLWIFMLTLSCLIEQYNNMHNEDINIEGHTEENLSTQTGTLDLPIPCEVIEDDEVSDIIDTNNMSESDVAAPAAEDLDYPTRNINNTSNDYEVW